MRKAVVRPPPQTNHLHRFARFASDSVVRTLHAPSAAKFFFTGDRAPFAALDRAAKALNPQRKGARNGLCSAATRSKKHRWNGYFSHFSKQAAKTGRIAARKRASALVRAPPTTRASASAAGYTLR